MDMAGPLDRTRYLAQMAQVISTDEVTMESTRHPIFLSPALCFVVTDAAFTVNGSTQQMRYGDLLIRTAEGIGSQRYSDRRYCGCEHELRLA